MASPPPEGSQQLLGGDDEVLLDVTDTLDIIQLAGLVIEPTSLVALTRESVQGPGMVEEGARVGEGSAGVTAVCPKPCETAVGTVHVVRQSAGNSERNAAADVEALQLQLSGGSSQGASQAERQAASQQIEMVADHSAIQAARQVASQDAAGQPIDSEPLVRPSYLMYATHRTAH